MRTVRDEVHHRSLIAGVRPVRCGDLTAIERRSGTPIGHDADAIGMADAAIR